MKNPSEKWVGLRRYQFFVVAVFCFFCLLLFSLLLLLLLLLLFFLLVCLFFLVDFSFSPHFSGIFMKIYCKFFLRNLVLCSVFLYLHYFAVFEFNVIKNSMFILKKKIAWLCLESYPVSSVIIFLTVDILL